jgi:hypothetical protein
MIIITGPLQKWLVCIGIVEIKKKPFDTNGVFSNSNTILTKGYIRVFY